MAIDPLIARGYQGGIVNAFLDSRSQAQEDQRRNKIMDLRAQQMQGEMDDDAEWDRAFAAKDVDTMMKIDPNATQSILQHWQSQQMAGLGDIPMSREKIDMKPLQAQENYVAERARLQKNEDRNYNLDVAREGRMRTALAPRPSGSGSSLETDGNGAVIDYGKTTDGERTAVGYLDRIVSARSKIESPELSGYVPSMSAFMAFASLLDDDTGTIGATAANKFLNDTDREYMGQALDLILAKMRKESGATIKGGEFRKEYINLFPMPNDPPKVLADKRVKRQLAENQLRKASGRAAGPIATEPAAAPAPADAPKVRAYNPQTGKIE